MQLERRALAFELKDVEESGTFAGYGAVFGNVDLGRDLVTRGAFSDTLSAWRTKNKWPRMLWQHNMREPIGVWTEMREDDYGLFVRGKLTLKVVKAAEAYALLQDGAIDGLSIGYRAIDPEYDTDLNIRKLHKVVLHELSIVTLAMNEAAGVTDVKDFDLNARFLERDLRRDLNLSSGDAVKAVSIVKKHLQREAGDEHLAADRDDTGAMTGLLESIRAARASR